MSDYQSKGMSVNWGVTLSSLKDEMYSLNMRLLLAMQYHNESAQDEIKKQIAVVQEEIDHMRLGGGR